MAFYSAAKDRAQQLRRAVGSCRGLGWLLLLALPMVLFQLLSSCGWYDVSLALRNEFAKTAGGQYCRLVTAPFLHLGWHHLLPNLLWFAVFWCLACRTSSPLRVAMVLVAAAAAGQYVSLLAWRVGVLGFESFVGISDGTYGLVYSALRKAYQTSKDSNRRAFLLSLAVAGSYSILYSFVVGNSMFLPSIRTSGVSHLAGIVVFASAIEVGFVGEVPAHRAVRARKRRKAAIDGGSEAPEPVQRRTPTSEEGNEDED